MPDGIIIVDSETVGAFNIDETVEEQAVFAFNNNHSLRDVLEFASSNGMTVELLLTPEFPTDV